MEAFDFLKYKDIIYKRVKRKEDLPQDDDYVHEIPELNSSFN